MTIRLLSSFDGCPPNSIITLDAANEAGMVTAKTASFDLTGGTPFVPKVGPLEEINGPFTVRVRRARLVALPEGKALSIAGATGAVGEVVRIGSSDQWTVGAGTRLTIGPFSGTHRLSITCTSGSIDATVQDAVLTVGSVGDRQQALARASTLYNPSDRPLQNYARTRAALLANSARIAGIGDSTEMGAWATTGTALNGNRAMCVMQYAAAAMNSAGFPSQAHSFFGDNNVYAGSTATTLDAYDPRVTLTSGWSASVATVGPCAKVMANSNVSTTPLSFTPHGIVDTFDVYVLSDTGTGIISLSRTNDTTIPSFNTASASRRIAKTTFSGARDMLPLNIARVSGYTGIAAIDAYDSTTPANRFWNLGWSSGTSADFANAADAASCLNAILALAPTCAFIRLGINDWRNGVAVATYKANLQALITALLPTTDVILETCFPSANSVVATKTQALYRQAVLELAAANNLKLNDINQKLGAQEYQAALGNYGEPLIHPNKNIYRDTGIGRAMILHDIAMS